MAWDSVPWFVGGGAEHSPEVARLLSHAATSGADGVTSGLDLKVVPLAVPGASVRVLKGSCVIPSRSVAAQQQSYMARNPSEDVVPISATGSGSGRNDMVIARVEDPFAAGETWTAPEDPKVGPYVFSRVLANVPASAVASNRAARDYLKAQGITGIPLAGIELPASTGTITSGLIRDLRNVAVPRSHRVVASGAPGAGHEINADTYTVWPAGYQPWVDIPEWATTAVGVAHISPVAQGSADRFYGYLSLRLGSVLSNVSGGDRMIDFPAMGGSVYRREHMTVGGSFADVSSVAGTRTQFFMMGFRVTGNTGKLVTPIDCHIALDITFLEGVK